MSYDRQLALRVKCPSCGSRVGDPCLTRKGKTASTPHQQRLAIAYKDERDRSRWYEELP